MTPTVITGLEIVTFTAHSPEELVKAVKSHMRQYGSARVDIFHALQSVTNNAKTQTITLTLFYTII